MDKKEFYKNDHNCIAKNFFYILIKNLIFRILIKYLNQFYY